MLELVYRRSYYKKSNVLCLVLWGFRLIRCRLLCRRVHESREVLEFVPSASYAYIFGRRAVGGVGEVGAFATALSMLDSVSPGYVRSQGVGAL